MVGQESIAGAIGPMARSARDLSLCIETILKAEPWKVDSSQVGMRWRSDEVSWKGGEKPRIGVMWNDGVVIPQPPMRRALKKAVDKLKAAGFEVVDYKPYKQAEAWDILVGTLRRERADGFRHRFTIPTGDSESRRQWKLRGSRFCLSPNGSWTRTRESDRHWKSSR